MNKAERDKLRESVVKGNTCWQTNYIHGDIVIALLDQIDALEDALYEIADFTNGYGDIAGIVNRMCHRAIANASEVSGGS